MYCHLKSYSYTSSGTRILPESRNIWQYPKGQLISKSFFGVIDFLQKTNENKSTWGIIVVKSNLFIRFLEETDDPKNHFEINWPLISLLVQQ